MESNNIWEDGYVEFDIVHEEIEEECADQLGIRNVRSELVNETEMLLRSV